jgi:hypothetical protein
LPQPKDTATFSIFKGLFTSNFMADDERNEPDFDGFPPIQSTVSDEFSKWQLWGEDLIDQAICSQAYFSGMI